MSPMRAKEIADTIHEITFELPSSGKTVKRTLLLNQEQKYLYDLFNFGC